MTIPRRVFVKSAGAALVSLGLDPLFRAPAAQASTRPILVLLFQRGAVDGLSMIVPHGDRRYYEARPHIAVPQQDVVDLDGYFGLHPRLAALKPFWDNGSLAVVHAVGSPQAKRNHFHAQHDIETGTPGLKATPDGWLNRYCRHDPAHRDSPFRAVAFAPELPLILAGSAPSVAIPRGGFGDAMRQIAQLIKANVGLQVACAEVTGWDTHVHQGASEGRLAARLAEFGEALAAFAADVGEQMRDVVVITISEFGRTIHENGSLGTDHGHATAMLLLGGPVNGGKVLGKWPGLDPADRFEGRDVAVTTDFRDVCGEVLVRHMGARDIASIFPGYSARFAGAIKT